MYTLRLPFELPDEQHITATEKPIKFDDLEFVLEEESGLYTLIIKGFSAKDDADKFISHSWSGFMWALINCRLASRWKTESQNIAYVEDPVAAAGKLPENLQEKYKGEVHGYMDSSKPAIYDSDQKHLVVTEGSATFKITTPSKLFFEYFFNGIKRKNWENGFNNNKLRIALELYGAYFSEATPNAKFLTLVMVFESLAEPENKPAVVVNLLANFISQIEEIESDYLEESDESVRDSLETLKRDFEYKKEKSIRKKVKSLVFDALSKNGDLDANSVAKKAVKIYDKRSSLIHSGSLPPEELERLSSEAKTIVERVLKAKFIQIVDGGDA